MAARRRGPWRNADCRLPAETLRALKPAGVRGRCIMLTVSDDERDVLEAMRAGADGYLLKDMEPEELYLQLKQAVGGAVVHIKHVLRKLNLKSRLEAAVWALGHPQLRGCKERA